MQTRRLWWLVILSMTGTMEASAQESNRTVLASLRRPAVVPMERRAPTIEMERETSFEKPGALSLLRLHLPLADRMIAEKGPFRTETRLPLMGVWNGRLQLSCVHQRQNYRYLHPAYLHSTRYQASTLSGVGQQLPRSRTNYGVTLSLHFGRRGNRAVAMLPAQSGEGR